MKRQDIEVGVEYAETGPLAYGREPHVSPRRVRFTDTRPGPWVRVITHRRTDGDSLARWQQVGVRIARWSDLTSDERALPTRLGALKDVPPGAEVTLIDNSIKAGLPAEYPTSDGQWRVTLVQPAAVHRTWAEVQARARERQGEKRRAAEGVGVQKVEAALAAVGLDQVIRVGHSGKYITLDTRGHLVADELVAMLSKWANERRPAGWGEIE